MEPRNERKIGRRYAIAACGAALIALLGTQTSYAGDVETRVNHLTFSRSVALPGVVLPPGAYTFELMPMSGNMVRVLTRNRGRVHFVGFTREVERPRTISVRQATVALGEVAPGAIPPITTWYPAGVSSGRQFIYK
jgi:hypothetical protein